MGVISWDTDEKYVTICPDGMIAVQDTSGHVAWFTEPSPDALRKAVAGAKSRLRRLEQFAPLTAGAGEIRKQGIRHWHEVIIRLESLVAEGFR